MGDHYECGTCGSDVMVLTAVFGPGAADRPGPTDTRWSITCGAGHVYVPIPGNVITLRQADD